MKKKSSHKSKNKKSKGGQESALHQEEKPPTWVDRVMEGWIPVEGEADEVESSPLTVPSKEGSSPSSSVVPSPLSVSIICWNVLADSYCSRRSHRHLPLVYQNHVFDRHQRQRQVRQILRRMANENLQPDILALQEVDAPLEVPSCLQRDCGYHGHHTPTDPSGKNGRVDSCALYYRIDTWESVAVESIRLDDIATLCSRNQGGTVNPSTRASLEGIETSFLRKNMALLVRLKHLETGQEIVVAVVHLFWNPMYQEVKLCQAHHVAMKVHSFANGVPVMFVGDTNSQPGSAVHEYLWRGAVNAKQVAPWYNQNPFQFGSTGEEDLLVEPLQDLSLETTTNTNGDTTTDSDPPQVRYLLDFTLNRLCRWLRILGIDAGLETDEEERMRTKDGNYHIFERCRKEKRTLVTSSSRIVLRRDCPPGTYRLDTKALSNLELTLVHLLLSHGVTIEPKKFLSTCVVCNGQIDPVTDKGTIESIFATHKAPESLNAENLEVFQCCNCKQGYWYDERPTSSASRVKNQATRLLKICIRGGVSIDKDMALFDFIDVDEVKQESSSDEDNVDDEIHSLLEQRLDILEWLQDENLQNPLGSLKSAFGAGTPGEEQLAFTNVTSDFVGHLDYIFHDSSLRVTDRLYVPTTFEELQDNTDVRNGHLLPSNVWPSDHLAIGAVFTIAPGVSTGMKPNNLQSAPCSEPPVSASQLPSAAVPVAENSPSNQFCMPIDNGTPLNLPIRLPVLADTPPTIEQRHGQRCDCGCVPNVMSLFEMAEARKKARAAAKK